MYTVLDAFRYGLVTAPYILKIVALQFVQCMETNFLYP